MTDTELIGGMEPLPQNEAARRASPAAAVPEGAPTDDTYCSILVREAGLPAARRCPTCGMGPCKKVAAAADPEGALPPLPGPCKLTLPTGWIRYTAEQMQAYARAAVEADRRKQAALQALVDQAQELDMGYGPPANRAQQGEPVAYLFRRKLLAGEWSHWETTTEEAYRIRAAKPLPHLEVIAVCRAATKAAAPADAPEPIATVEVDGDQMKYLKWVRPMWHILERGDKLYKVSPTVERAAPVPDTGIPAAGEVPLFDSSAVYAEITRHLGKSHCHSVTTVQATLDALFRLMQSGRAPVSSTPTSGEVEKAPCCHCLGNGNCFQCYKVPAAPSHPSEAKAGCPNCPKDTPYGQATCPNCTDAELKREAGEDA